MDKQTEKWAEEIAELREQQGMTFKAIGERYQISPGRASYLYQNFLRRRRIARFQEQHEEQNRISVSFALTLGEVVILQRILFFYQNRIFCKNGRRLGKEDSVFHDPDYIAAGDLSRRLFGLERETRLEARKDGDFSPKPIDISDLD